MSKETILRDLQDLVDKIELTELPYQKGNTIRIGHMLVQKRKNDYTVYDTKENKHIAHLFCKTSAVALAKCLSQGYDASKRIRELDHIIQKNYIDCLFYKNTINKTKDTTVKEVTSIRYDIARTRTHDAKEKLDRFIFS